MRRPLSCIISRTLSSLSATREARKTGSSSDRRKPYMKMPAMEERSKEINARWGWPWVEVEIETGRPAVREAEREEGRC